MGSHACEQLGVEDVKECLWDVGEKTSMAIMANNQKANNGNKHSRLRAIVTSWGMLKLFSPLKSADCHNY